MLRYLAERLLGLIPTLIIVAVLVFLFVHLLPGDPARLASTALVGRIGESSDISAAVRYLAESSYVTGHVLNVDGGFVGGRS